MTPPALRPFLGSLASGFSSACSTVTVDVTCLPARLPSIELVGL
jgi:hypothetical protein